MKKSLDRQNNGQYSRPTGACNQKLNTVKKHIFHILLALTLAAAILPLSAIPADAADADALAGTINDFRETQVIKGATNTNFSAAASGNTVTVTGSLIDVQDTLELDINTEVTVQWGATLTQSDDVSEIPLIKLTGPETFEVTANGAISTVGRNSYAIYNTATGAVTVSGGAISTTGEYSNAIYNESTGAVTVSGGAISTAGKSSYAIYNAVTGDVTVSGGAINTTGEYSNAIYNAYTGDVTVSGGAISAAGDFSDAIYNYDTGAVTVSGGEISATGDNSYAIYKYSTGAVTVENAVLITSGATTTGDNNTGTLPNITSAIEFTNEGGIVTGDMRLTQDLTLYDDLTIPAGESLTIGAGVTLTIPNGAMLTNNGIINIDSGGALNNQSGSTVTNGGTINIVDKVSVAITNPSGILGNGTVVQPSTTPPGGGSGGG